MCLVGTSSSSYMLDLIPFPSFLFCRLQSEESLTIIDLQRQQEVNWMNTSRIREESSIIKNIKKRELVELKKKEPLVTVAIS